VKTACVVLAAGLGKRMNSDLPKVLHRICGVPMLQSVLNSVRKLNPEKVVVVAGEHIGMIKGNVEFPGVMFATQPRARGTGDAVRCALPVIGDFDGDILILNGDTPLVRTDTIKKFLRLHRRDGNAISVVSFEASDPSAYGRIVRNTSGRIEAIVEEKDADRRQKEIREVNSGLYAVRRDALPLLGEIKLNRVKGEYYLTDIVSAALGRNMKTSAYLIGAEEEFMGVNTKEQLRMASDAMKRRIIAGWAKKGVDFIDPGSVFIHCDASIGRDTVIYPNVHIEGRTKIGKNSTVYPNVRILDSVIGREVLIKDSTLIENARVGDRASIGPFAHVRPGSQIGREAKVGNFVELKKTVLGAKSKASHLSYLGDAKIGSGVNIGAGTITCNYDGERKHATRIGDGVFVGSDSQLVAPVSVGRGAYVAAGSTITQDVPAGSLAISRTGQKNIRGWVRKRSQSRIRAAKKNGKDKKD
jgi:bifunctional UDP-N-acetylglucosamine pyrophosphorylase / glucosamine-1-phosphate N-acetyltransferase